jgi:cell division protein FtsL
MNSRKLIVSLTIVSVLCALAVMIFHESSRLFFEESIPVEFKIVDTLLCYHTKKLLVV